MTFYSKFGEKEDHKAANKKIKAQNISIKNDHDFMITNK